MPHRHERRSGDGDRTTRIDMLQHIGERDERAVLQHTWLST